MPSPTYLILEEIKKSQLITITGVDVLTAETLHASIADAYRHPVKSAHDVATGVHGVGARSIVGTALTQTLSAKTLTTPKVDVINEETAAAGVTVDGVLMKDNQIVAPSYPIATQTAAYTSRQATTRF